MASKAYSVYCFEVLAASLEKREALPLEIVERYWVRYQKCMDTASNEAESDDEADGEVEMTEDDEDEAGDEEGECCGNDVPAKHIPALSRAKDVSRPQNMSPASGSSSSTPSTLSTTSSQAALGDTSKSSSKSSFFSFNRKPQPSPTKKAEEHPLFVTWNTVNARGYKSLRGCIGTFDPMELSSGFKSYALTAAFDDTRFSPITRSELPSLSVNISILMNFTPCANPTDWEIGTYGIRIFFTHHSRRHGATYLPEVAAEQGWTKEETIVSLMRKAGWSGRSKDWNKVSDLKMIRYEGKQASIGYQVWKDWRDWVEEELKGR